MEKRFLRILSSLWPVDRPVCNRLPVGRSQSEPGAESGKTGQPPLPVFRSELEGVTLPQKDQPHLTSWIKAHAPWWLKLSLKVGVFWIPEKSRILRFTGFFRNGSMMNPVYAVNMFESHFKHFNPPLSSEFGVLELGPGDTITSAVIAHALGASHSVLVDAGRYATPSMPVYRQLIAELVRRGYPRDPRPLFHARSIEEMLSLCHSIYLTGGLPSLRSIASSSMEFLFSSAVLEHVYLDQVDDTLSELFRIAKPGAISPHVIDFSDHLADSLHSLRFSAKTWESHAFRTSGFYTNRIRLRDYIARFKRAGWKVERIEEVHWGELPVPRRSLNTEFRDRDDLLVRSCTVVCRKPAERTLTFVQPALARSTDDSNSNKPSIDLGDIKQQKSHLLTGQMLGGWHQLPNENGAR